ncbi:MAG: zinc metallopeptidase [Clostridia bacterium]|nr:zinc metallopeptidase [Clostridia bacterium]
MYGYYLTFMVLILICSGFCMRASAKVKSAFDAYSEIPTSSRMTGYDTAKRLLRIHGAGDISVEKVRGKLTDHYHPTKRSVNLSESVFGDDSVAAVAVAAHEVGHVLQKKSGYFPYKIRAVLVPITNFGSRLAFPLVLVGLILDISVGFGQSASLGFYLAMAGVVLYGLSTVFAFATLPVEFDASRRAKKMLVEEGILTEDELPYADKMLGAAAQTYVASTLLSLVYFLRFLVWVLMIFGGRRRRD